MESNGRLLRNLISRVQAWLVPELAYLRGKVDTVLDLHTSSSKQFELLLAGQAKLIGQGEKILAQQQTILTILRAEDKDIKAMTKSSDAALASVQELKNDFNAYTAAAGASIQAKIDAAVKAKEDGDDALFDQLTSGIKDVATSLVQNTPVPAQPATPDAPATPAVDSPISDLPPADSTGTGTGSDTTGGSSS